MIFAIVTIFVTLFYKPQHIVFHLATIQYMVVSSYILYAMQYTIPYIVVFPKMVNAFKTRCIDLYGVFLFQGYPTIQA